MFLDFVKGVLCELNQQEASGWLNCNHLVFDQDAGFLKLSWLKNRTSVVHIASSNKNPFYPNPEMFKYILSVLITLKFYSQDLDPFSLSSS